jgi:hypothetical protein
MKIGYKAKYKEEEEDGEEEDLPVQHPSYNNVALPKVYI